MNLISFSLQLLFPDKINSLEKLQEISNHVELLDKVLLDSAMETFSTGLRVCFEQMGVYVCMFIFVIMCCDFVKVSVHAGKYQ